jgi:hypothetical protein
VLVVEAQAVLQPKVVSQTQAQAVEAAVQSLDVLQVQAAVLVGTLMQSHHQAQVRGHRLIHTV